MSITRADMRAILNQLIDEVVSGTTTADGDTDKKSFVDENLAPYEDSLFRGRYAFLPGSGEVKRIDESTTPEGKVVVYGAFSNELVSGTAYEIHRFNPQFKNDALNRALRMAYPKLYKLVTDESLEGKGGSDTEYEVPAAFASFPLQVYAKYISGSQIAYTSITVDWKDIGGTKKFYASIPTTYKILLVGRTHLSEFTNDSSTTELTPEQAQVVCELAAAYTLQREMALVNSEDRDRLRELAQDKEAHFWTLLGEKAMPYLEKCRLDWSSLR